MPPITSLEEPPKAGGKPVPDPASEPPQPEEEECNKKAKRQGQADSCEKSTTTTSSLTSSSSSSSSSTTATPTSYIIYADHEPDSPGATLAHHHEVTAKLKSLFGDKVGIKSVAGNAYSEEYVIAWTAPLNSTQIKEIEKLPGVS